MNFGKRLYAYDDLVEISAKGFAQTDDPNKLLYGRVVGKVSEHIIDFWIVELDEFIAGWDYKAVSVACSLMRPKGSNEEFACFAGLSLMVVPIPKL